MWLQSAARRCGRLEAQGEEHVEQRRAGGGAAHGQCIGANSMLLKAANGLLLPVSAVVGHRGGEREDERRRNKGIQHCFFLRRAKSL